MPRKEQPTLFDRLVLRFWVSRILDGLWIGTLEPEPERELIFQRVEQALELIKAHDRRRYDRLTHDLKRVMVRLLPAAEGSFNASLLACNLDTRFVLAETTSLEVVAAAIVHEATHARLWRCGIDYPEDLRERIEETCFRRELAFAARLPNGEEVRQRAELAVAGYPPGFWTETAFEQRNVEGYVQALTHLGVPAWLVRTLLAMRAAQLRLSRILRRSSPRM